MTNTAAHASAIEGEPIGAATTGGREKDAAPEAEVLIRADDLGKRFKIFRHPWHRLGEWCTGGLRKPYQEFWAVRGISFRVRRGECVGVVGPNGSGKSTLLKLIAGALYPTEGTFELNGRVLSLIELGTGINPMMSGRQNIENLARLLAFPPGYAKKKMPEIQEFAELGEFFNRPVRLYSSGMRARLSFSMFACFRPEVFIVDEVLSVGDVMFQQKCATRLREMLDEGMSMLFVSHDTSSVLNLCDEAILLWGGEVVFQGDPEEVVSRYYSLLRQFGVERKMPKKKKERLKAAAQAPGPGAQGKAIPRVAPPPPSERFSSIGPPCRPVEMIQSDVIGDRANHRHGQGGLRIVAARVTDEQGRDTVNALVGQTLCFHLFLEASEDIDKPRAGLRFFNRHDTMVFAAGTYQLGHELPALRAGERVTVRLDVRMDVDPGQYTFGLGAGDAAPGELNAGIPHDRIDKLGPLIVRWDASLVKPFHGVARLPMAASHRKLPAPQPPPGDSEGGA
jgi:lipopolysaccharide transport system ATP-binding protein